MTFKKCLKSNKAQSALEYIMVFVVLAAGAVAAFVSFSPDDVRYPNNEIKTPASRIKNIFGQAVNKAIGDINEDQ